MSGAVDFGGPEGTPILDFGLDSNPKSKIQNGADRLLFGALLLALAMSPFEAGYRPLTRFFAARLTNLELTLLVLTAAWLMRLAVDPSARSRLVRMPLLLPILALVAATIVSWAFGEY